MYNVYLIFRRYHFCMVDRMIINYEYYKIFYYVAKYKSFTKAAEVLLNNQPNITRSIKNLETALGCTLFIRSNRGVSLTAEGEILFERVSVAFEQIQMAEEELALTKSLDSGIVNIGATEIALHGLLFDVLNDFHRKYPNVKIKITNQSTPNAIKALQNSTVDFAVITSPINSSKQIKITKIKSFQDCAVCGNNYIELKNKSLSFKDLEDFPIISLPKDTATYDFFSNLFFNKNVQYSDDVEVETADQILPMVKYNLGVGFLPDFMIDDAIHNNQVFKLDLKEHIPTRYICLAENKESATNLAAKKLKEMILNKAQITNLQ